MSKNANKCPNCSKPPLPKAKCYFCGSKSAKYEMLKHKGDFHDEGEESYVTRYGVRWKIWYSHKSCINSYLFGEFGEIINCMDCGANYDVENLKPWNRDKSIDDIIYVPDYPNPCPKCGSVKPISNTSSSPLYTNDKCWFCGLLIYPGFQNWEELFLVKEPKKHTTDEPKKHHNKCLEMSDYETLPELSKDKRSNDNSFRFSIYAISLILLLIIFLLIIT